MAMNHYISVYQKDYTWPYPSRICHSEPIMPTTLKSCTCGDSQPFKAPLDTNGEAVRWSRMDPLGGLLDPKLYLTKAKRDLELPDAMPPCNLQTCSPKETKCPILFEMKPIEIPDETIAMLEADRFKTTYQIDYSHPATKRMVECENSRANGPQFANNSQLINQQCYIPRLKITIETDPQPTRPSQPSRCLAEYRPCAKKFEYFGKCGKHKYENDCGQSMAAWRTEYRDNINRIGQTIMKAKLHQAKKAIIPAWTLCK